MPKLLQINVTANWGSTGKIAEQIGLCAQAHGWESYIAFGDKYNLSKSSLIKIGGRSNRYLHFAEQRIRDNEGLCSRRATRELIEKIKEIGPDVVGLHNLHDHYLNYRLLFEHLNKTDIKVVWTFHDCWAFTGHCMHFITKDCERWKTGCYDCLMKGEYPKTLLDRSRQNWELKKLLFGECKNLTIVAVSDWIADFVRESYLRDKRLKVIHNGCDVNTFKPIVRTDSNKYRIIAVSSVWYPNKGENDIYKLRTMLPEDEFEITMVGLSAEQAKNLPRGIKGIQRTQNVQDLARLYSDADVLINPTYEDNFPTVNIEALACGTPVITYRTGGSPEAIDEKTGAVVEQGNLEALAATIREFRDTDFKKHHTSACRKRAEECFDKDKCFEKYVELYERLMNDNKIYNQ